MTRSQQMSTEPVELDHNGDVKLELGQTSESGPIIFTACSRTLARVSTVFDRMLYGHFGESRSNTVGQDWVVKLPNDKIAPLSLFLYISHGHFDRVPKVLSLDELYDLAVLTHYYCGTSILGPWVDTWTTSIADDTRDSNIYMAKALWVYWEFGRKEAFVRTARRILLESKGLVSADDPQFEELQMPPDIIERITEIRLVSIRALLNVLHSITEKLLVVDSIHEINHSSRWCRHATWMGPNRCESMILGSITLCLTKIGLWPLPTPVEVQDSLVGLYQKITRLDIDDLGLESGRPTEDHRGCNPMPFILEEVEKIMGRMETPVTKFHHEHLDAQARKLLSTRT